MILEKALPAVCIDWIQRLRGAPGFYGDYEQFIPSSYQGPLSINVVPNSPRGRDRQLLNAVDEITSYPRTMLDVGGADGYAGRLLNRFGYSISQTILETAEVCHYHRESGLRYVHEMPDEHFDIVHASGLLQYLKNPYESLKEFAARADWLILNRIPLYSRDRITEQITEYGNHPAWFFDRDKIQRHLQELGQIVKSWPVPQDCPLLDGRRTSYVGVLVKLPAQRMWS